MGWPFGHPENPIPWRTWYWLDRIDKIRIAYWQGREKLVAHRLGHHQVFGRGRMITHCPQRASTDTGIFASLALSCKVTVCLVTLIAQGKTSVVFLLAQAKISSASDLLVSTGTLGLTVG